MARLKLSLALALMLAATAGLAQAQPLVAPALKNPNVILAPGAEAGTIELTLIVNGHGRINLPGTSCIAGQADDSRICKKPVAKAKPILLEAVPGAGLALTAWTGACKGQGVRCTVTPDKDLAIAATFLPAQAKQKATVTIAMDTPGGGGVVAGPFAAGGFNCKRPLNGPQSGVCKAELDVGTPISLIAKPDADITFGSFYSPQAGCGTGSCDFTLKNDVTIRAAFIAPNKTLVIRYLDGYAGSRARVEHKVSLQPYHNMFCTPGPKKTDSYWTGWSLWEVTCVTQVPKGTSLKIISEDGFHVGQKTKADEWGGACKGVGVYGECALTLMQDAKVEICKSVDPSICSKP